MEETRLNKFLAERLGLSRRSADDLIAAGKVTINGEVATLGARIKASDKVICNDKPVDAGEFKYTYLMFNKPAGYVCSRKKQGEADTIYSLLPEKYHSLKTVGRLDKDTSGLIFLTNDGEFSFKMTHPQFEKTKSYLVVLNKALQPLHQQMISDFGINLPDGKSKMILRHLSDGHAKDVPKELLEPNSIFPEANSTSSRTRFEVTIHEGRNRQIRRTFEALGYKVVELHRYFFDGIVLSDLPEGEFKEFDV